MLMIAVAVLLIASTTVPALALLPNGQQAPNFQLNDLSGNSHKLSDYRGKVVIIDFFGWACGYCISDAKTSLVPLYNTYYKNDAQVQFLSVEVNGGSAAQIQGYLQQTGVPWLVLAGGGSLVSTYNFQSTPTLYVIDPAGKVALSMQYPTNVQTLKSTIDALEGRAPAACAQNANSLDLFAKGTGDAVWWKHWTGTTWTASTSLGGILTSPPAATSPGNGLIDVFVRGTDGVLYEKTTTNGGGSWSNWISLGGQILPGTGPAVCTRGLNSLDVFVQGTDHVLYYKQWDGTTWSGWKSLGPGLTSSPGVTSQANGKIDVFVRGTDNAIWYREYSGSSWSTWHGLSGLVASGTGPAACSWGTGRLDVFVQGTDGVLYQKTWTGSSWSGWQSLSGKLASSPAATSPASGVINVFVRGTDGALYQKTYNGAWSGWAFVGGL
jgi:thiol-disulfide isomerase/thioredoxin